MVVVVASVAVLSDIHGVLPALDAVLAEAAVRDAERNPPRWTEVLAGQGAHWALLADGAVTMRRTSYDTDAACALVTEESSCPEVAEWADYFLRARASDADALAVMAPRDGRPV